jgi:tRNA dimethylallyltransferase
MKPKIVIVLGPTGVGKTDTVLELAAQFGGEIISADSQQVYRHMDIGTAKPSAQQRATIAHHLIDVVEPDEEFNAAIFRRLALASAQQIVERGRNILVCGGTGLYIKALTTGLFEGPGKSAQLREVLQAELLERGLESLYGRLLRIDPVAGNWVHPNDRQRIVRALEVFELTGKPMSAWQREHAFGETDFEMIKIGLDRPRLHLYEQINRRCVRMMEAGLLDEVKGLRQKGYGSNLKPMQSIGYRHAALVIDGQMGLTDAVELMKRDSRRLAKRQLTWFRNDRTIHWFDPQTEKAAITSAVREFLR